MQLECTITGEQKLRAPILDAYAISSHFSLLNSSLFRSRPFFCALLFAFFGRSRPCSLKQSFNLPSNRSLCQAIVHLVYIIPVIVQFVFLAENSLLLCAYFCLLFSFDFFTGAVPGSLAMSAGFVCNNIAPALPLFLNRRENFS